jgi:hypothetical protein
MKGCFQFLTVVAALLCSLSSSFCQCLYYPVSLEQRVNNAQYIVLGTVTGKESYVDETTGNIQTLNKLQVTAWLKNRQQTSELYVITWGGIYNNRATKVWPSLQLAEQQEYVLLLDKEEHRSDNKAMRRAQPGTIQAMAYADAQGALPLQSGLYHDLLAEAPMNEADLFKKIQTLTGEAIVTPQGAPFAPRTHTGEAVARIESVTSFSPTTTYAGTIEPGDFLTITGSGFGTTKGTVSFANADDGGSTRITPPYPSDYVSWSDNSITVKVPENAGTGSFVVNGNMPGSGILTIPYAHMNVYSSAVNFSETTRQRYYLRNLDGFGGYTFLYNAGFYNNTAAVAAFERALVTWRCATGVNFNTGGTTTSAQVANDGINTIFFDNTLALPAIGQTITNFLGSGISGQCDQANTVWWATDIDMRFRPDPPTGATTWNYGPAAPAASQIDFESVVLHELGHAHGLGHVIARGQVMHYATLVGVSTRTLSASDLAGAKAKMAYSTVATCFNPSSAGTPMVAIAAASCAATPFITENFTGSRKNSTTDQLSWTTIAENNNTGFYIQRSGNGVQFSDIGFVASKGNSTQNQDYAYEDATAGPYAWYYRLRQVDANGRSSYSVSVFIEGTGDGAWRVWGSGTTLYVSGASAGVIKLYAANGQLLLNRSLQSGVNTLPVNTLQRGVYFYRIVTPTATITQKVLLGK